MSSITTQDYAKFDACVELVGNDGLRHDFLQKFTSIISLTGMNCRRDFTPHPLKEAHWSAYGKRRHMP